MSDQNVAKTLILTEKSNVAADKTAGTSIETVAHLASAALHATAYEGIQQTLTGATQLIDHVVGTNLAAKVNFIKPQEQAKFGSAEWHAQQIGGAVGQLLPYLLANKAVKPFFKEASVAHEVGVLAKPSPLGLSMRESMATGFVSQFAFHASSDKDNFWQDRLTNGANGAITMATLTASAHGLSKFGESAAAKSIKFAPLLKNSIIAGALSGAPAGVVGAELDSFEKSGHSASLSEIGQSVYGMSLVGGTFGAMAHLAPKASSEVAAAPKIDLIETTATHALPHQLELPFELMPLLEPVETVHAVAEGVIAPEVIPERPAPPAVANFVEPPRHQDDVRQAQMHVPEQLELDYPEPLTPQGVKAWRVLDNLEKLTLEENKQIHEGNYPMTVEEAQAILILVDEWTPGANRLYRLIGDRGPVASKMAYSAWVDMTLNNTAQEFPKAFEQALLYGHEDVNFAARDKFIGVRKDEGRIGIETKEDADSFLKLWRRSKPFDVWTHGYLDADPATLMKMTKWSMVDQIPDQHLKAIATHFEKTHKEFSESDESGKPVDLDSLIAAAPGWNVLPSLPLDMAIDVAKLSDKSKLAAVVAMETTMKDFPEHKESAEDYFSGESGAQTRPSFYRYIDEFSALGTRTLIKKLETDKQLPVAVDVFVGDSLSPEMKRELVIGLNPFKKANALLVTMDVPTYIQAFEKLVKDNPPEEDGTKERYKDWQNRNAVNLAAIFKSNWTNWLEIQEKAGRDHYQATDWLRAKEPATIKGLGQFLLQHGKKAVIHLESIAGAWSEVKEAGTKDFREALRVGLLTKYDTIKDDRFAEEASRWGVPKNKYEEFEARYMAAKDVPSPFPLDEKWSAEGLTGRFIPRDDPRGLFLGKYTNCCQHPNSTAQSSAWYGQENPKSGFFVVENGEGDIVAQSWSVVTDNGGLIFDNVEAKGIDKREEAVRTIYRQAAGALIKEYHTITLGGQNSDLNLQSFAPAGHYAQKLPVDFSGYTDTKTQVLLGLSSDFSPRAFNAPLIRGALSLDKDMMSRISQARFPDGWRHLPYNKDTRGLVIDDPELGVLGYALYEPANHHITDLAVKPDIHSRYGVALTSNLFRRVKEIGGDWTADMRPSTSYRMIQKAAKTGHVRLISDEISESVMGAEPMHHVVFSFDKEVAQPTSESLPVLDIVAETSSAGQ